MLIGLMDVKVEIANDYLHLGTVWYFSPNTESLNFIYIAYREFYLVWQQLCVRSLHMIIPAASSRTPSTAVRSLRKEVLFLDDLLQSFSSSCLFNRTARINLISSVKLDAFVSESVYVYELVPFWRLHLRQPLSDGLYRAILICDLSSTALSLVAFLGEVSV